MKGFLCCRKLKIVLIVKLILLIKAFNSQENIDLYMYIYKLVRIVS